MHVRVRVHVHRSDLKIHLLQAGQYHGFAEKGLGRLGVFVLLRSVNTTHLAAREPVRQRHEFLHRDRGIESFAEAMQSTDRQ